MPRTRSDRKPAKKPRVRRAPEDARQHILDAADRVFARRLPDSVGLREIAAEATISHGLITHYFDTYENLVGAVIARRFASARELADAHVANIGGDDAPLLAILTDLLDDKTLVRLLAWASLNGHHEVFLDKPRFANLIDAMEDALRGRKVPVSRESLEIGLMLVISVTLGWSILGRALEKSAGRKAMTTEQFRTELRYLIRGYTLARESATR